MNNIQLKKSADLPRSFLIGAISVAVFNSFAAFLQGLLALAII
jgi:hypothetical protein